MKSKREYFRFLYASILIVLKFSYFLFCFANVSPHVSCSCFALLILCFPTVFECLLLVSPIPYKSSLLPVFKSVLPLTLCSCSCSLCLDCVCCLCSLCQPSLYLMWFPALRFLLFIVCLLLCLHLDPFATTVN